jgi:hypothetical protein
MTGHGLTLRHKDHKGHKDHQPQWLFLIFVAFVLIVPEREPSAVSERGGAVGEPLAYWLVPRLGPERVSSMQFDRTERTRVEWPVLRTLDRREARLLGVNGAPLPVDLPLSEDPGTHILRVDLALDPLLAANTRSS